MKASRRSCVMIKLIPSNQVQEYLDSIHFTFSDFEKATLIWNNNLASKEEKKTALKEIMDLTKDEVLKKQIYERLDYEQKVYVDFMDDADDEYVYSIENSLGFARCKKVKDAIEYCLKLSDAELEKVTIVKHEAKDLFHIDEEDIVARADFNEKKELCIYSKKYDKDWQIVDDWKRFEQHYVYIPTCFQCGTILRNVRTNEYTVIEEDDDYIRAFIDRAKTRGWDLHFYEVTLKGYILRDGMWYFSFINITEQEVATLPKERNALSSALEAMSDYVWHRKKVESGKLRAYPDRMVVKATKEYATSLGKQTDEIEGAATIEDLIVDTI